MWWIPAILSMFGAVKQYKAGQEMKNAAGEQARQAAQNKEFELQTLAENQRRQELQDSRLRGSAMAKAAASGARVESGSLSDYMSFMEGEQSTEMKWMLSAGKTRADLNYAAGLSQAEQTKLAGKAQMFGAYSTLASGFAYAGQTGLFGGAPKTPTAPDNWFA